MWTEALSMSILSADPPQYVLNPIKINAITGESPTCKFTVTAVPEDTKHSVIDKNGKVVENFKVGSGLITFHNVKVSDSGEYTICCHDSRGTEGKATFELIITNPSSSKSQSSCLKGKYLSSYLHVHTCAEEVFKD